MEQSDLWYDAVLQSILLAVKYVSKLCRLLFFKMTVKLCFRTLAIVSNDLEPRSITVFVSIDFY